MSWNLTKSTYESLQKFEKITFLAQVLRCDSVCMQSKWNKLTSSAFGVIRYSSPISERTVRQETFA